MHRLKQYLEIKLQSKVGVTTTVVTGLLISLVAMCVVFLFALLTAYAWLALRYSAVTAGLVMLGVFLLIALLGSVAAAIAHRRAKNSAEQALKTQNVISMMNPATVATALHIANRIGWQKIIVFSGVGILAAGLIRELSGRPGDTYPGE